MTEKDWNQFNESCCKNMIESVLCYGGFNLKTDEVLENSYLKEHRERFGDEQVKSWIDEIRNAIDHIEYNVGTDSEGVEYNSIVYKKDVK